MPVSPVADHAAACSVSRQRLVGTRMTIVVTVQRVRLTIHA